jgi:uncharacterized protein YkwD
MKLWKQILDWFRPRPRPTPPPADTNDFLALVNAQRAAHGLQPLILNIKLSEAAQLWAESMARSGSLSHGDFAKRIRASGYTGRSLAENIAGGQKDATEAMKSWMNSSGHKANILNPTYRDVGFGGSGTFWVADFGGP